MSELKAFRIIQGDTGGYGAPSYKCDADGNRTEEWSDACEVYDKSEADKVIAELKEKCRWRKCSEEMPEDGAEVLASDGDGIWLCYKTTMCDGSPWFQPDGLPHIEDVTHWMPLPKTPKEAK